MKLENLFPLNNLVANPELRSSVPLVMEYHSEAMGAMVAGVKATDFDSEVGLGKGEVLGIIPLRTKGAGNNEALAFQIAASGTAGKVTVTMHSTDAAATDNLTIPFFIVGRLIPVDVS